MLTVIYGKQAFTGVFVTALLCDLLDRDELVREDQFLRSYSLNQTHVIITITYTRTGSWQEILMRTRLTRVKVGLH